MMMKRYREAYVKKLDSKKVPADVQTVLDVSSCDRFMVFFFLPLSSDKQFGADNGKFERTRNFSHIDPS